MKQPTSYLLAVLYCCNIIMIHYDTVALCYTSLGALCTNLWGHYPKLRITTKKFDLNPNKARIGEERKEREHSGKP